MQQAWSVNCHVGIESILEDLQVRLPGWWCRVGECQVSCDASIGANESTSRWHQETNPDNKSYDADMMQPSTLKQALGVVMAEAQAHPNGLHRDRLPSKIFNGIEIAIARLREALPSWWYVVEIKPGQIEVSTGPTSSSDAAAFIKKDRRFDNGFHSKDNENAAIAIDAAVHQALAAITQAKGK